MQKLEKIKDFLKRNTIKLLLVVVSSVGMTSFSLPVIAFAELEPPVQIDSVQAVEMRLRLDALANRWRDHGELPQAELAEPRHFIEVPITAYSSDVWQCDSTPFITASNTRVRDGVVAANFLPIGARVRLPELYGDKVFIVEDRMNTRYHYHLDVWMSERTDAVNFGVQYTTVEIF